MLRQIEWGMESTKWTYHKEGSFVTTLLCLIVGRGWGGGGSNCKFWREKNPQVHLIITRK